MLRLLSNEVSNRQLCAHSSFKIRTTHKTVTPRFNFFMPVVPNLFLLWAGWQCQVSRGLDLANGMHLAWRRGGSIGLIQCVRQTWQRPDLAVQQWANPECKAGAGGVQSSRMAMAQLIPSLSWVQSSHAGLGNLAVRSGGSVNLPLLACCQIYWPMLSPASWMPWLHGPDVSCELQIEHPCFMPLFS